MPDTDHILLKQFQNKYMRLCEENGGMTNVSVYARRFVENLCVGKCSLHRLKNISAQSMLASVITAGVGVCKGIAGGMTLTKLLPYYIITFFGLYLYVSVLSIVDIPARKELLENTLVDYLENRAKALEKEKKKEVEFEQFRMPRKKEIREVRIKPQKPKLNGLDWTGEIGEPEKGKEGAKSEELVRLLRQLLS